MSVFTYCPLDSGNRAFPAAENFPPKMTKKRRRKKKTKRKNRWHFDWPRSPHCCCIHPSPAPVPLCRLRHRLPQTLDAPTYPEPCIHRISSRFSGRIFSIESGIGTPAAPPVENDARTELED